MSVGSSDILFAKADGLSDVAKINTERAVSELRYGRPVIVRSGGASFAVLAVDAAAPAETDAFFAAGVEGVDLFLSAQRARALGLSTIGPVNLRTGSIGFDELSRSPSRRT